ncbi:unnamed protein product (macronuclear) [Paramecium tetraurelia]|uniref:Uncharacterized protein n=1 Tax=Paramecium tetraurelia TaxID=5888 RepID=A0BHT7_PARTE|nr:uncharacterized protein GSPATT00029140001 [Paramecium tetraurelia]CAK58104.1 unnamed protein product [Paramecium tetraurelia]|eukprot:XP_001425502.1 hypothetical protein (macronuclear) [Paramecium tetraurelia strain d4-2]
MIQDATDRECVYKHKDCPILSVLDNQNQKLKENLICTDCLDLYELS